MNASELKDASRDKLVIDFKTLVADAENYVSATAEQTGEAYAAARRKLETSLNAAKAQAAEARRIVVEKTRAAAQATDVYVHQRPWESIALGAGLGLLVGLFIGRR